VIPLYRRHFEPGQLQFITSSTYRRTKLFEHDRSRSMFVEVLRQLRQASLSLELNRYEGAERCCHL
jgi:hypothetical protein